MITLDLTDTPERVVPITTNSGDTFDLIIRPPTVADELGSYFSADPFVHRLSRAVVGWRGIRGPDGKDIPYSTAALAKLLRRFPECVGQIVEATAPLYVENEPGESAAAPSDGSGQPSAATQTT